MNHDEIVKALIAELATYVGDKETCGSNRSPIIDKINAYVKNPLGANYCLAGILFAIHVMGDRNAMKFDLVMTGGCQKFFDETPSPLKFKTPEPGDIVIWKFKGTWMGHAGFVEKVSPDGLSINTIEFNTRDAHSICRDGDGVYRRVRSVRGSAIMQVMGFVRVVMAASPVPPRILT